MLLMLMAAGGLALAQSPPGNSRSDSSAFPQSIPEDDVPQNPDAGAQVAAPQNVPLNQNAPANQNAPVNQMVPANETNPGNQISGSDSLNPANQMSRANLNSPATPNTAGKPNPAVNPLEQEAIERVGAVDAASAAKDHPAAPDSFDFTRV